MLDNQITDFFGPNMPLGWSSALQWANLSKNTTPIHNSANKPSTASETDAQNPRIELIKKLYKIILGRQPTNQEIYYFTKNSELTEHTIAKILYRSSEHLNLITAGQKVNEIKSKIDEYLEIIQKLKKEREEHIHLLNAYRTLLQKAGYPDTALAAYSTTNTNNTTEYFTNNTPNLYQNNVTNNVTQSTNNIPSNYSNFTDTKATPNTAPNINTHSNNAFHTPATVNTNTPDFNAPSSPKETNELVIKDPFEEDKKTGLLQKIIDWLKFD